MLSVLEVKSCRVLYYVCWVWERAWGCFCLTQTCWQGWDIQGGLFFPYSDHNIGCCISLEVFLYSLVIMSAFSGQMCCIVWPSNADNAAKRLDYQTLSHYFELVFSITYRGLGLLNLIRPRTNYGAITALLTVNFQWNQFCEPRMWHKVADKDFFFHQQK